MDDGCSNVVYLSHVQITRSHMCSHGNGEECVETARRHTKSRFGHVLHAISLAQQFRHILLNWCTAVCCVVKWIFLHLCY